MCVRVCSRVVLCVLACDVLSSPPFPPVYSCPPGKAYLVRPPEGLCGFGGQVTPTWPCRVFPTPQNDGYTLEWECCKAKGLASNQFIPSHHSNKTVTPLDCPIVAVVARPHGS